MKFVRAKPQRVESTRFSRFIREARSSEKKRVYSRVLKRATDRQERILRGCNPEKA
jgi:hypothetical protein